MKEIRTRERCAEEDKEPHFFGQSIVSASALQAMARTFPRNPLLRKRNTRWALIGAGTPNRCAKVVLYSDDALQECEEMTASVLGYNGEIAGM